MKSKSVWGMLKQTFSEFGEDRVLRHSAALAYYAVFSIGPLLVLIVGVAGLAMGEENVRAKVHEQLTSLLGANSAGMVESMMDARKQGGSLLATVIGGVALLIGASGVFGQLQDSLNTIWEVKSKPGQGIWGFIRQRFLSMTMVLGIGFLLLVSMVLTVVLNAFAGYIGGLIGLSETVTHIFNFAFALLMVTVLFALIFKVLPDVRIPWRSVWVGAVGTALLFTAGKYLLGWYLGREGSTSVFGAAAGFVVVLMYVYYSALILFLGAEFTQVYARSTGEAIRPTEHAVPVTENERANEGAPRRGSAQHRGRPAPAAGGPRLEPAYGVVSTHTARGVHSPVAEIRAQPVPFVVAAAVAGLATGAFFTVKRAKRAVQIYGFLRKAKLLG